MGGILERRSGTKKGGFLRLMMAHNAYNREAYEQLDFRLELIIFLDSLTYLVKFSFFYMSPHINALLKTRRDLSSFRQEASLLYINPTSTSHSA